MEEALSIVYRNIPSMPEGQQECITNNLGQGESIAVAEKTRLSWLLGD